MPTKFLSSLLVLTILAAPLMTSAKTTTKQLILNGSFEDGQSYWDGSGDWWSNLFDAQQGDAYASIWPETDDSVYANQTVDIPKNAKSVTLSYWYQFASEDYPSVSDDFCAVSVDRADGDKDESYYYKSWHPGDDSTVLDWQHIKMKLPFKKMRGKRVIVEFYCSTDLSLDTWLWVDNVQLSVTQKKK